MVYIVIIEPHPLLRLGLSTLMACLTSADHIKTQDYDDLYQSPPHSGQTDVVLLAAHPHERINLLIQAARRAHAPRRMVLMSEAVSPPPSWTNLPSFVVGYVSTMADAETILASIRSLINYKSNVRASTLPAFNESRADAPAGSFPLNRSYRVSAASIMPALQLEVDEARLLGLSSRQYDVLVLLAQGYPIKLISRQLNISVATTKGYLESIYQRFGVHNRSEAVFVALAQGAKLAMSGSSDNDRLLASAARLS
ncbi:response regulator transcription factor [Alcaligenaceae bacterium]|nr:response regulator transcription factor [Alcaligenaceae bacterium]